VVVAPVVEEEEEVEGWSSGRARVRPTAESEIPAPDAHSVGTVLILRSHQPGNAEEGRSRECGRGSWWEAGQGQTNGVRVGEVKEGGEREEHPLRDYYRPHRPPFHERRQREGRARMVLNPQEQEGGKKNKRLWRRLMRARTGGERGAAWVSVTRGR